MSGNAERNLQIVQEFQRRRTAQLKMTMILIPSLMGLFWLQDHPSPGCPVTPGMATALLFVAIGAALIFSLKNWRCPGCNRYIGKAWHPRFCSGCGVPLRAQEGGA